MIYTPLTKKALLLAYDAHKGQLDRAGLPYIFHPYHLAEQMDDEISCCAALLHDVVEDTEITMDMLREEGFPEEVLEAVNLLTHREGTDYFDYIRRIKGTAAAVKVKLADLEHNSDTSRLDSISPADEERLKKYTRAKDIILGKVMT